MSKTQVRSGIIQSSQLISADGSGAIIYFIHEGVSLKLKSRIYSSVSLIWGFSVSCGRHQSAHFSESNAICLSLLRNYAGLVLWTLATFIDGLWLLYQAWRKPMPDIVQVSADENGWYTFARLSRQMIKIKKIFYSSYMTTIVHFPFTKHTILEPKWYIAWTREQSVYLDPRIRFYSAINSILTIRLYS